MKRNYFFLPPVFAAALAALALSITSTQATAVFSDNFDAYANGNLVGNGFWLQTSSTATTPVQVTNHKAVVGTSGQDIYATFSSAISPTAGTSIYYGMALDVTSAQATGDYFMHVIQTAGQTSGFYDKLWAKSTTGGYFLGSQDSNGTVTYGTTVLTLGSTYRVVVAQNFVSGGVNDTFAIYINPTDLSVPANNTAYLTAAWSGAVVEATGYTAINIRQGSSAAAAGVILDDLVVSQTFSDVSAVPEPSTMALIGLGGVVAGLFALRRRKL